MICERCGTENIEGAIFCKKCGRRLDGLALCPHCNKLIPADGEYCIYCGSNRNATIEENVSNKILEVERSKSVNSLTPPKVAKNKKENFSPKFNNNSKCGKVLSYIGTISSWLTVLVAVIFTFLIGATPTVSSGSTSVSVGSGLDVNLYYYFNDAFNEFSSFEAGNYFLPGALTGLITVTIGLLTMVWLIVLSIIKIVRSFKTYNQQGITAFALTKEAAMMYFVLIGFICLFMLNVASCLTSAGVTMAYQVNGLTITGIILGGIFLLISLVIFFINKFDKQDIKKYIISICSSGLIICFSIVALAMIANGLTAVKSDISTTALGLREYCNIMGQEAINMYNMNDNVWNNFIGNYIGSVIMIGIILFLSFTAVESFVLYIKELITNEELIINKKMLVHGCVLGSSLIAIGTLLIIHDYVLATRYFPSGGMYSFILTSKIILIICGLLTLVGVVVSRLVLNKTELKEIDAK